MKIAVVGIRGIPARYSGVETSVDEISRRLGQKGYEIIIYCRKNTDRSIGAYLYKNVRLVYIPTINSKHLGTLIHTFLCTLHIMFSNANIVHFHSLGPSFFSFLPRLAGKKTIVTVHGLDWKRKKWGYLARRFLKLCEYSAVFFPNKTIVISKTLKDYFEKKFKKEVFYIANGANIYPDYADKEMNGKIEKYILFVGRLVPEKGIHYLIRAFNELGTNIRLLIAGESSFTDKYVAYLHSISGKNVQFLGFAHPDTLRQLYINASLFVLPSEVEGSSVSLLEAMSYGKCVLVSDIPESREVVENCGISFRSGDCLDLKNKLQYLIDNTEVRDETGRRARKRIAEYYNWEHIVNDLEALYLGLGPKI
jgi:glycosyltransferase involved in cell wall biosynthesis